MVADKIKHLREQNNFTQSELARELGITRSSVNAWEMGISVPSTHYIVELAMIFNVSADYLLGINSSTTLNVSDLTDSDIECLYTVIAHLRKKNNAADNP